MTVQLYVDAQNGDPESARNHSKYAEYIASGIITAQNLDGTVLQILPAEIIFIHTAIAARYNLKEKATGVANSVQDLDQRYGVSTNVEKVRVNVPIMPATLVVNAIKTTGSELLQPMGSCELCSSCRYLSWQPCAGNELGQKGSRDVRNGQGQRD